MKFGTLPRALTGALMLTSTSSHGLPIQYAGNRAGFEATLSTKCTDDYSAYTVGNRFHHPSIDLYTDAGMNAVLGETDYRSTGFPDIDTVQDDGTSNCSYCAGCNNSFELAFTSTSVDDAAGALGVGFDIMISTVFHAFVTFGDKTALDVNLSSLAPDFWGITANERIRSLHLGLANGGTTQSEFFRISNLTIGREREGVDPVRVRDPAGFALLGAGLFAAG